MDNVLTEQQRKDSWIWLFAAGVFAIGLGTFIFCADRYLSTSNREKQLGATLYELRSAQASLPTSIDPRQLGTLMESKRMEELK
jgi:hypothetical protein